MTTPLVDGTGWKVIDVISDLHLQSSQPETAKAWFNYMASASLAADAIFILGDWFEVWIGDDDDDPFTALCAAVMRARAKPKQGTNTKPCELFLMHGNRDFLIGTDFADRCDATLLQDPTRLDFNGTAYLLTHGDALCTDDTAYMRFRDIVRSKEWQAEFLAKPLEQRRDIAKKIRQESQAAHRTQSKEVDINVFLAVDWLNTHGCDEMIHGHTHSPKSHVLGSGMRHVLSDWDADASTQRTEVLRLSAKGVHRIKL